MMSKLAMREFRTAFLLFFLLSVSTGLFYPLCITWLAQTFFPWQAQGSLVVHHNQIIGSAKIGQFFTDAGYFWGRPSSTPGYPYDPMASAGSNLGPSNPILWSRVRKQVQTLVKTNPSTLIPIDLVTASGSGLDPDISPEAALYQVARIAKARQLSEQTLIQLVKQYTTPRTWGFLGEPRVNVLALNLALDLNPPAES